MTSLLGSDWRALYSARGHGAYTRLTRPLLAFCVRGVWLARLPGTLIPTGSSKCMATIVDLTTLPPVSPISIINETTQLATSLSISRSTLFESNNSNILFFAPLVGGGTFLGVSITVSSRKRAHYGISPPPTRFLLRSKVYSNMRPYVAALEYTYVITIKWAWLRSLAVHDCSFEAETRQRTNQTKFYGCLAGYFSIVPRLFEVQSS